MADAVPKDISRYIKPKSPESFRKQIPTLLFLATVLGTCGALYFLDLIGSPIKPEKDLISKTIPEPTPTKPSDLEPQKAIAVTGDTLVQLIENLTGYKTTEDGHDFGAIWWRNNQPLVVFKNRQAFNLASELLKLDYLQPNDQVKVGSKTKINEISRNLSPNLSIWSERTATQDNETLWQLFVKTNGQDDLYDQDLTLIKVGDHPWMVEITKSLQAEWTIVQQRMSLNNQTFHQVAQQLIAEQGQ